MQDPAALKLIDDYLSRGLIDNVKFATQSAVESCLYFQEQKNWDRVTQKKKESEAAL